MKTFEDLDTESFQALDKEAAMATLDQEAGVTERKVYEAPTEWLKTQEVPEVLGEIEKQKPTGFAEGLTEDALFKIPVTGPALEGMELARLKVAANRINNPDYDWNKEAQRRKGVLEWEYNKPRFVQTMSRSEYLKKRQGITAESAKQKDIGGIEGYIKAMAEREERGYSIPGRIGQGISILPAWMFEFALTGGLYRSGSAPVKKFLQKQIKSKLLARTGGWLTGSAVRTTVGMPQRVFANTMRRSFDEDEGWATAIAKGWGETFIEAASEEAGQTITKGGMAVIKKLPFGNRFLGSLQRSWSKLSPNNTAAKFAKKMLTKGGYSNLIGEIGEERLATIMHGLAGTSDIEGDPIDRVMAGLEQDLQVKNMLIEAAVLSVPGAVRLGAAQLGRLDKPKEEPPTTEDLRIERDVDELDREYAEIVKTPPTEVIPSPDITQEQLLADKGVELPPEAVQPVAKEAEPVKVSEELTKQPEIAPVVAETQKKSIEEREDSELIKRWAELDSVEKARRKPQEITERLEIEEELFKRHEPEKRDISEKSRKKAITDTEEEIKSYDLYRDALQSIEQQQQQLPPTEYIIARTKEQIPDEIKDYIGKPGAKGYKGYLWKYLTTYDENPNATGWDEALEKVGGRPGDIGDFIEKLDNVVQLTKGKEIISQQALDIAIGQGDLHAEIMSAKYEMLKEGFGATEINEALNQIAEKEDIDPDMIKGYYLPIEVTEYVRTKQEILGELLQKSRTAAKKAPRGRIEEEAVKKATELAHKHKIPFFVHERAGEGSGLYSVTKNPPTRGKFTKVTPPEPGELAGKVTEEYIPEKEKPTFAEPPRPEGPNVLMLTEVERRLDEKAMLSENRKLRPGARRLAKQFIGKTDLKTMTEEELSNFGQIIGKLPEPTYNNKGERIPPSIPKTTAITKAGEFEKEYKEPTFMRIFHAPEYYAEKLGVKSIVEKAEAGKITFSLEYQLLSNQVDKWVKRINKLGGTKLSEKARAKLKNLPTRAVARFRELLDTHDEPPDTLNNPEKELFNNFRELTRWLLKRENAVRESLELEPIQYRKAYVRHVAKGISKEILEGKYPFPQSRKFWAEEVVAKKIYNPMEMHRTLTEDVEEIFSRDLGFATKSMLWTALKEIHLSQPIRYLEQQLTAKGKDTPVYKTLSPSEQAKRDKVMTIPSRTRRWVKDYVNTTMKGQQSWVDQDIEAIVKQTGIKGLLNKFLKPFGKTLSYKPISRFFTTMGRAQIMGVLGGPFGGRPRQIIRNKFQTLQNMAMYPLYKETWRTYAPIRALRNTTPDLERMLNKSLFLKAYTGTEEWPVDIKSKIAKTSLMAYQWSAVTNARQAMECAYWGMLPLFNNQKFKYYGWADPQRTYKEKPEFLYPSEEKWMLKEMEFGAAATQHNYTPIGMPEMFRHKTLTPFTRLQSWWMNHYFRFTEEALRRAITGKPTYSKEGGPILPWKYRLGWLRYLLIAVPILNALRYQRSYLFGAAPTGLPPSAQFAWGMYNYVVGKGAGNDRQWKKGKKQMIDSGKTFIPGYMAFKDVEAVIEGRKDPSSLLWYKKR